MLRNHFMLHTGLGTGRFDLGTGGGAKYFRIVCYPWIFGIHANMNWYLYIFYL